MLLSLAIPRHSNHLLAEHYSKYTAKLYKWGMLHALEIIGDVEIDTITARDLNHFIHVLTHEYVPKRRGGNKDPLSTSSLKNVCIALNSFYAWAVKLEDKTHVYNRPFHKLEMPKAVYREINPLSSNEIELLANQAKAEYEAAIGTRQDIQQFVIYLIVLIFRETGMRVSELTRLEVGDFSTLTNTITVRAYGNSNRKTKFRQIAISAELCALIKKYLDTRPLCKRDDSLVLRRKGQQWTRSAIRHALIRLSERAEISRVHPHVLRHTFGTEYIRHKDGTFSHLMYLMGENTFAMVDHYVKLNSRDIALSPSPTSVIDKFGLSAWL